MAGARKLGDDFRYERDTSLAARNFPRDAYEHSVVLLAVMGAP